MLWVDDSFRLVLLGKNPLLVSTLENTMAPANWASESLTLGIGWTSEHFVVQMSQVNTKSDLSSLLGNSYSRTPWSWPLHLGYNSQELHVLKFLLCLSSQSDRDVLWGV